MNSSGKDSKNWTGTNTDGNRQTQMEVGWTYIEEGQE